MENVFLQYSLFETIFILYLGLAIAKTILCYANAGVAAGVCQRKTSTRHAIGYYLALVIVLTPIVVFLRLPFTLWSEGLSFFTLYSRRATMRDVLAGF